jgi:hypothetical protein
MCQEHDMCLASSTDYACSSTDFDFQCLAGDEIPQELLADASYTDQVGAPEMDPEQGDDGLGILVIDSGSGASGGGGGMYTEETGSDPRLLALLWHDHDGSSGGGGAGSPGGSEGGSGGGGGGGSSGGGSSPPPMPEPGAPLLFAIGALLASCALRAENLPALSRPRSGS